MQRAPCRRSACADGAAARRYRAADLTQVPVPSTLTNPGHRPRRIGAGGCFTGSNLPGDTGFVRLRSAGLLSQRHRGRQQRNDDRDKDLRIRPFTACAGSMLPDEFDAHRLPRRQTTSQFRPVLASRENASRNWAGNTLGSSTVILAPEADMSCTTQGRAAKPPSRVIHPGWCSDLRASRFFVLGHFQLLPEPRSLPQRL